MSRKADNEYLSERDKAIQKQMFMLKRKLTELKLILSEEVSDESDDNDDSTPIQGTSAEMVTRQSHGRRFIVLLLCCYCRATLLLLSC